MQATPERQTAPVTGDDMARLLELVRKLVEESASGQAAQRVHPHSRLDSDLGLDSLARSELIVRCERAFGVNLPEAALQAETPEQLLRTIAESASRPQPEQPVAPDLPSGEETVGLPDRAATLPEALEWHVREHPDRPHLYIYGDGDQPTVMTYAQLDRDAAGVAAGLQARGIRPGDTIALMLPTGRDYFASFFGILHAGAVPVPIYPPARPSQLEEHLRRHGRILTNAEARLLVTVPEARRLAQLLKAEAPRLDAIVTADDLRAEPGHRPGMSRGDDDLAMLQYTSGSTGDPKGVSLAHRHLLANIRAIGERVQAGPDDVFVSWLPLYHDMGLIGAWFGSLYFACPLVVMSPIAFLTHPLRWLELIHRHRATISASPNFGYELCLRAAGDQDLSHLDLSSWRLAFNGAEPVSPTTLRRFHDRFSANGLRWEALLPVYGLAEAAVGLTIPPPGRGPVLDTIDRDALASRGEAHPVAADDPAGQTLPSAGPPLDGYEVRIVDGAGHEQPDRHQGTIQFRGPSTTPGYYRSPHLSEGLFRGDWLDSGDLGYMADGELYVTGRIKDMIVRGGRNIYPYEVEESAGRVEGVRKGCVAVFGSRDPDGDSERLVVVAETRETDAARRETIEHALAEICVDVTGVPPDDIRLVPPHSVLKTSSGKIRRTATRELYETGRLGESRRAVWWQLARLTVVATLSRLRERLRMLGSSLYAGYAWAVFGAIALPAWVAIVLLPTRPLRWGAARLALRIAAPLLGVRLSVEGLEHLPRDRPVVLVSNHASYVDPLVLTAALPVAPVYLAKRELEAQFFPRLALQRLGTLFVERFDLQRAREEANRAESALRGGASLAFFPEGTFSRATGVRQFHLGAFQVAAHTGTPVVPVALSGTRNAMRGTEWFPKRTHIHVSVGRPIEPDGTDWDASLRLRDRTRAFIVAESGEPDLLAQQGG
ncbi:AMP-binding protein [Ectothiorhodospiraceae bacterium WFHF3C12]|nr:AMP-binding protein [Ectothiorhodospiraceae bacterium WFHF3C12]